jgi:hypothetical protein
MVNLEEVKYHLSACRTRKVYLVFLVAQLLLAIAIVPIALTSPSHFRSPSVLILELVLFLLFAFDLYLSSDADSLFGWPQKAVFARAKVTFSTWGCSASSQPLWFSWCCTARASRRTTASCWRTTTS